jgi:cell division septal protein FtsQ
MKIRQYKKNSHSAKKKSRRLLKLFIGAILLLILAGEVFYLIIFSGVYRINRISISGAKETKQDSLQKLSNEILSAMILGKIPKNNPLFLSTDQIRQAMLDNFPRIKSVSFKNDFKDHILFINVSEREPAAVWCRVLSSQSAATSSRSLIGQEAQINLPTPENCFFIDSGGFIYSSAPILSGGAVPTVYEENTGELSIGSNVSNPDTLQFILAAKKELAAVNLNLTDFIIKSQSVGDLEILTPEGWIIYLDFSHSASSQINALRRVLEDEIKDSRSRLEYIDLRVPNRAYYKLK